MRKRYVRGNKGPGDMKLEINTDGEWYCMPYYDLLHIIQICMDNEDRIYPPPDYLGGKYLEGAIRELFSGMSIDEIAERRKLRAGILFLF